MIPSLRFLSRAVRLRTSLTCAALVLSLGACSDPQRIERAREAQPSAQQGSASAAEATEEATAAAATQAVPVALVAPAATQAAPAATAAATAAALTVPAVQTAAVSQTFGTPRALASPLPRNTPIVLPEPEGELVALLLPQSGRFAALAEAMLDAVGLAFADHAASGALGQGEGEIVLRVFDSGTGVAEARLAAEAALAAGAGLVLGPLLGEQALAAGEVLSPHGVSVLSFSNDLRAQRQGVFLLGRTPQSQLETIVEHAHAKGLRRFALFAPRDDLGQATRAAFESLRLERGLQLVADGFYDSQELVPNESVRQFLNASPRYDVLFLTASGEALTGVANSFAFHDLAFDSVQLVSLAGFADARHRSEPALHGAWFAAPNAAPQQGFARRFEDTLGYSPPLLAGLAYDAASMAVILRRARVAGTPSESSPWRVAEITRVSGFFGVNGLFRLHPNGSNERALAIFALTPKGTAELAPAPLRLPPTPARAERGY